MIMSITVIGGDVGGIWNTKTSIARPMPEITPRPIPPYRLPIYSIKSKNKNWIYNMIDSPLKMVLAGG